MALALSNTLITVGEVAERQGNYLEARGAYEAALEDPDPLVVANAHACLGRLSWLQGAYEASFNSFERARAIAARLPQGWRGYGGDCGEVIAVDRFGASAPGRVVLEEYGFTVENICARARALEGRT